MVNPCTKRLFELADMMTMSLFAVDFIREHSIQLFVASSQLFEGRAMLSVKHVLQTKPFSRSFDRYRQFV
ncbi:hypothetical protein D1227_13160 [Henriciella mobilis]|nr:hypothetical protein D1231_17780 [Henriciella mobilis]RIJ20698.1 hypothetical protein D1227_13160 [Henriciella mobilis]